MVSTWRRQWFRTPGLRAFFLMPQSWTDESIPLTVSPRPDEVRRVMVMRTELLTPSDEQADVRYLSGFDVPAQRAGAEQHFASLGRFAEPRIRRALAIKSSCHARGHMNTWAR
jgi:hypothetical protein